MVVAVDSLYMGDDCSSCRCMLCGEDGCGGGDDDGGGGGTGGRGDGK